MTTVAGVDIGSNTLRLLIARVEQGERLVTLEAARQMTRLGEGMGHEALLRPSAVDRSMRVLQEFQDRIARRRPDFVTMVATSAVREAANRAAFLQRILTETGLTVDVLSGQEEARQTLLGAWWGLRHAGFDGSASCLLLDIGGGSTEYVLGRDGTIDGWASTPLGVVRLTERFLHHDPPAAEEIERLRAYVAGELERAASRIGPLPAGCRVAGTAGTVTTLGALLKQLTHYDPSVVNGVRLPAATVDEWLARLIGMTAAQRRALPLMEGGRADLIVAGGVVLQSSLRQWRLDGLLVSDWGLKEGIILEAVRRRRSAESLRP
jgi:exopolyphosphatase / guanosine-5'-triphosphate,3'-diphosphate pyrophosphatase